MGKAEKQYKETDCKKQISKEVLLDNHISFNISGRDSFIDFLKAYCILVVVFCHGFPYLDVIGYPIWGGYKYLYL